MARQVDMWEALRKQVEQSEADHDALVERFVRLNSIKSPRRNWLLMPWCAWHGHKRQVRRSHCRCRSVVFYDIVRGDIRA